MGCPCVAVSCCWATPLLGGKSVCGDAANVLASTDIPRNNAQSYKKRKNTGGFSQKKADSWALSLMKGACDGRKFQFVGGYWRAESMGSAVAGAMLGASGLLVSKFVVLLFSGKGI